VSRGKGLQGCGGGAPTRTLELEQRGVGGVGAAQRRQQLLAQVFHTRLDFGQVLLQLGGGFLAAPPPAMSSLASSLTQTIHAQAGAARRRGTTCLARRSRGVARERRGSGRARAGKHAWSRRLGFRV